MNHETAKQQLEAALRQYKHNDSSGGLVFAYELSRTEVLVETLLHELEQEHSTQIDLCTDHGDALAALDDETLLRLIRESGVKGQTFARAKDGIELDYPKAEIERFAEAVRHLTASGVPEEVRRLPEKMKEHADRLNDSNQPSASRHVTHWAERLEAALASAPADGRKPVPGVVRDHFHAVRDCLIVQAREYEYGDEDNPNAIACRSAVDWLEQVVAAASQRGGER